MKIRAYPHSTGSPDSYCIVGLSPEICTGIHISAGMPVGSIMQDFWPTGVEAGVLLCAGEENLQGRHFAWPFAQQIGFAQGCQHVLERMIAAQVLLEIGRIHKEQEFAIAVGVLKASHGALVVVTPCAQRLELGTALGFKE